MNYGYSYPNPRFCNKVVCNSIQMNYFCSKEIKERVMEKVIKLDEVDKYNKLFGLETRHPLVSVVDLSKATHWPEHFKVNYGVYALYLKKCPSESSRYSVSSRPDKGNGTWRGD